MLLAVLTPAGHDAGSAAEVAAPSWIAHPQAAFDLSATEVTVAQYRACIGAGACVADAVDSGCNYGNDDKQTHPVNCVTHVGATQFCAWAGGRLCSQSEWLAACRGIDNRAFPYGEIFDLGTCNANSTEERPEGRPTGTWPVGSHPSCQGGLAGLYDMAGNVAEWIADCKGTYCKFRGGSHMSNPPVSYFTACTGVCSGNQETLKSGAVGFRCCRDGGGNGTVH
jgi:formylglycine-generating enzyme required for sulfatase activity